jgi:hypothetical protein
MRGFVIFIVAFGFYNYSAGFYASFIGHYKLATQ